MEPNKNWKTLILLVGGVAGLATGLAAAMLIIKRHESTGDNYKLNSSEGFKIGVGVVSLLRQISDSGFKK
jgi:hypothetical protein